jgi:hypothetical protein
MYGGTQQGRAYNGQVEPPTYPGIELLSPGYPEYERHQKELAQGGGGNSSGRFSQSSSNQTASMQAPEPYFPGIDPSYNGRSSAPPTRGARYPGNSGEYMDGGYATGQGGQYSAAPTSRANYAPQQQQEQQRLQTEGYYYYPTEQGARPGYSGGGGYGWSPTAFTSSGAVPIVPAATAPPPGIEGMSRYGGATGEFPSLAPPPTAVEHSAVMHAGAESAAAHGVGVGHHGSTADSFIMLAVLPSPQEVAEVASVVQGAGGADLGLFLAAFCAVFAARKGLRRSPRVQD